MKKYFMFAPICLMFILFSTSGILAQDDFYIPLDIQKAYDQGTRSLSGKPGSNYWQNRSDYEIKVVLDPENYLIRGEETINYLNNSPDSLNRLVIRLYQDIFKKGTMRDFPLDPADLHEGVTLDYIRINGDSVQLNPEDRVLRKMGTNIILKLAKPLLTDDEMTIEIGWETTLPKISRLRMGAYGDSAFFVAYWYPQIAVYDDIDGWDIFSYTGLQEFYNDFGDFDVEITVPGDFIVWATGVLQNADEVLREKFADRYEEAFESDSIIHIISADDYANGAITADNKVNTWHFEASYVPDFAFAASNKYLWDATSLVVDDQTERRVMVDAAYRKDSQDFYDVTRIARESIHFFSTQMPGVPFPYPKLTVFNGSGGMEFPMMVNDGTTQTKRRTIALTSHEISHTYFPFYMGTNERKYAWMDEGWAVMLPFKFLQQMTKGYTQIDREIKGYNKFAGRSMEVPLMIPSVLLRGRSYRIHAYSRPGVAYKLLYDFMGERKFKNALHTYMNQWHGKHPIPYDFFHIFNQVNGENLNWFWKPWFFEPGYPDLRIKSVDIEDKNTEVVIEKLGNLPVPIKLKITYADSSEQIIEKQADVWKDGKQSYLLNFDHETHIDKIELGGKYIPDINPENNIYVIQ